MSKGTDGDPTITLPVRGDVNVFPPFLFEAYRTTVKRAPFRSLLEVPLTLTELTGPGPALRAITPEDADLTRNAGTGGEAMGQRIIVTGRVLDELDQPIPHTLLEIWQTNAAGRYVHRADQWPGPLDPHFIGMGRCLTDAAGVYRFLTISPGAYPWRNHENAWRPAHIHFSLFGPSSRSRLVTQMYFPGEPLNALDPILNAVPEAAARDRLIARYVPATGDPYNALVFEHQIVLRGRTATPEQS